MSQVVFVVVVVVVDREINQEMFVFDFLVFGRNSPILFALTERSSTGVVFISISRILSASYRILLVLKIFLPPCKQPLNFQKPTSYRFHE